MRVTIKDTRNTRSHIYQVALITKRITLRIFLRRGGIKDQIKKGDFAIIDRLFSLIEANPLYVHHKRTS